ncbi:helix-turn-helix transcriptional regulator [Amycolatopsis pithecellobii]|uniref:HTH luxR-type domain-containing protein n=1 Tax=Amycolatopsis pithecellobii TaxID=664692 RepID=A0A6N7YNI7_9PSEU|nr:helix-turn-helix transcriptional regulator [Amycolatopsis pithecellobii]MTD54567.1 hypothetical protein [Amycolatopsis pithecellobii]
MTFVVSAEPPISSSPAGLAGLVDGIGERDFGNRLLALLHDVCGADYCTVFHLNSLGGQMVTTAGLNSIDVAQRQARLYLEGQRWKSDPMILQSRKQLTGRHTSSVVHMAVRELPDVAYRDRLYTRAGVCDRVLLCGRSATGVIGLSVLRTSKAGIFGGEDLRQVHEVSSVLLAIIDKHVGVLRQDLNLRRALTSLDQIENCLTNSRIPLSPREKQVCARILYGMSSNDIAIDLHIGDETATTYRKRAYQRLEITTQRELLLWYLDLWEERYLRGHAGLGGSRATS